MFNSIFGVSAPVKYSFLIVSASLLLFGVGYIIKTTTGLIDEVTEKETDLFASGVLSGISDVRTGFQNIRFDNTEEDKIRFKEDDNTF